MKKLLLLILFVVATYLTLKILMPCLGFDFKDFLPSNDLMK